MNSNPYKIFFPIGLSLGLWGVFLWVGFNFHWFSNYPGAIHADVMISGFLFSFATGFLMTAIPRFTGTDSATRGELLFNSTIAFTLMLFAIVQKSPAVHILGALGIAGLIAFGARRFLRRSYDPPSSFLFVGLGLILGLAGAITTVSFDLGITSGKVFALGRLFYLQGMMLSLVLGIGSRLIPALLGWAELPKVQISKSSEKPVSFIRQIPLSVWITMLLLLVSFPLEAISDPTFGRATRAIACTWIAFHQWRIHCFPRERTRLTWALWISCWFTVLGLFGYALSQTYAVHFLHLTFIGGFGLMTLMIASRVILSHGGHDMNFEEHSKAIRYSTLFIALAALTRAAAPLVPSIYQPHLTYAAICWIIGVCLWGWAFMQKLVKKS